MYDQLAMSGPLCQLDTGIEYRLSSFVFGACPSDWSIEVEETVDGPSFFGDFWSFGRGTRTGGEGHSGHVG